VTDVLLLASAHAGSAEEEAVQAACQALGTPELVVTATPEELDAALDRLDGRVLAVAGGDGSLHLTVKRLHARGELADTDLGLIPLGTGNDLARALGLPLDPAEAARVVLEEPSRPLDLLQDSDGELVVNAVHVGVGADAAQAASRLKSRLGPLAYPLGAVVAGLRSTGWRLKVTVDGVVVSDGPTLMVGVGNGRGIGGGTPLLPHARPDDGLLDVVVSRATGPLTRLRYGAALSRGTHLASPLVGSTRGRTVTVEGEPVGANADGELSGPATRRTWTVQPGAWSMRRPHTPLHLG
jgi:diacylglycerol kinase family enzyme